jgi:hypothetical protein
MIQVRLVVLAAITLSVLGMLLVIGGVLAAGLFLPGVVLTGLSLLGYAAAAVLAALRPEAEPVLAPVRRTPVPPQPGTR